MQTRYHYLKCKTTLRLCRVPTLRQHDEEKLSERRKECLNKEFSHFLQEKIVYISTLVYFILRSKRICSIEHLFNDNLEN